ncbi:MAG: flippase [Desulfobacteraceae bacterium]|nr:flippase [Desulfobacteraceae bacterium]
MIRSLIRDSAIYTIPAVFSRGLSFFLIPLYTRVLTPADYGTLDLLIIFGNIVNLTIALEVSQGLARYYSDANDETDKMLYASTALWFTISCYTVFLALAWIFSSSLSNIIMGQKGFDTIFKIAIVYIFINGLFYLIQNQFRWELRSKNYVMVSLFVTFVTVCLTVIFIYFLKWGLEGFLYGMISGPLAGSLMSLYFLRKSFRFRFHSTRLKAMLLFSIPLVPSGIAVFFNNYIDRLMINHYMSFTDLGLYGIGFRIASIVGIVMVGFQGALTPLIYKHYQDNKTPIELSILFRLFLSFVLILYLGISLFSHEILWIMTTPDYYSASEIVMFLTPAILLSNMYIFAPGIDIEKKTYLILWITMCSAILNIALNFILIPLYGLSGAAVATLISRCIFFITYMILSQKFYYVPHNWKQLYGFVAGIILLILCYNKINIDITNNFLLKVGVLFLALLFLVATGLLKRDEIKKIETFT